MHCSIISHTYVRYLIRILGFCFFISIPLKVQSKTYSVYNFSKVTALEGLKVKCLLQDKQGFMWIGTEMGLYRYDGYSKQVINSNMVGLHLSADNVLALYEDRQGKLWIGTGNGLNCFNSSRTAIEAYLTANNQSAEKNVIRSITQTQSGTILCSTEDGYIYQSSNHKIFTRLPRTIVEVNKPLGPVVMPVTEDEEHNIWVADAYRGFQKLSPTGKVINHFPFTPQQVHVAYYVHKSTFFYVDDHQVFIYSHLENKFRPALKHNLTNLLQFGIRHVYQDQKGYIWMVTQSKLLRLDTRTEQIEDFTGQFMSSGARHFQIDAIYDDGNGQLWFGSYFGVFRLNNRTNAFDIISLPKGVGANPYPYFSTRGMVEAANGELYIGSYSGFFKYNPIAKHFIEYRFMREDKKQVNPLARALVMDAKENLWIATEANGLLYFNTKTHSFTTYLNKNFAPPANKNKNQVLSSHNYSLLQDTEEQLWLGGYADLYTFNPQTAHALSFNWGKNKSGAVIKVMVIYQSSDKSIWVGTDVGLYQINKNKEVIAHYAAQPGTRNQTALTHNFISCIYEDKSGHLWVGTKGGGINVLNPATGQVEKIYTTKNGLPHDIVCAMLPGNQDELWISTDNGLSRLNRTRQVFHNFYLKDGLPGNEFNQGSALASHNGKLYFGGIDGIVGFYPQEVKPTTGAPQVMLTKLVRHDGQTNQMVETVFAIRSLKKLVLQPRDEFFTVHFALKNNFEPTNATYQFAYKLEGLNNRWQDIGTTNYLQFVGLPAGQYILRLKGAGSSGIWSTQELSIPILIEQAWYKTTVARILYVLIALFIIGSIGWFQIGRIHLQNKLKLESLQRQQLREVDELKSRFFTNIAHELRTPLTLILGPAEKIVAETNDNRAQHWAAGIRQQSRQMLQLINQLLDLSRLESGQEKLHLSRADIVIFIQDLTFAFQDLADQNNVRLTFKSDIASLVMPFDSSKIWKIMANLLANALKYTPEAGEITVSLSLPHNAENGLKNKLIISVQDTGSGIPAAFISDIFKRYYRVPDKQNDTTSGTGIGLALVKELVDLHHGEIHVESEAGKGTSFSIRLNTDSSFTAKSKADITSKAVFPDFAGAGLHLPTNNTPTASDEANPQKQLVLVVEDHNGVRAFIKDILLPYYEVLEANNGLTGIQIAQEKIPEIIISDVMMPGIDGNELCKTIKQNEKTSHIPIILLTGKASQESRLQGLETGADIYLSKPFDERELLLHIKNLINLSYNIAAQFTGNLSVPLASSLVRPLDKSFLERFTLIAEAHLSDEQFSIEEMASQMAISRTQLHRKLKAITGESASALVRIIRLQHALKLLQTSELTVAEISFQVGFASPSYFTETFHKHYGYLPTEARRNAASRL